jgi:threonine 3-dehydrogenase
MLKLMKALIFDKSKTDWETSRGFEMVDVPEPVLGKGDEDKIIIKVAYAGVCGTDKGIWNRQAFKEAILGSIDAEGTLSASSDSASPPKGENNNVLRSFRIIGHEFFGEVKEVGLSVKNIKSGDFVACESHVVCNKCYQCLHGQKNVCTNEKILGISVDGGFAEFAKVPAQVAWKTDTSKIRPEVAAMQEPFGNAVHAASKVDVKGKSVAIFGLGPIGMFLTIILKGMGAASIIGIEPNPVAEDMARKLGIDYVIPLLSPSPSGGGAGERVKKPYAHNPVAIEEIKKITNGLGVDVAFEMAGFNDSVNNAIASARRGGDVILFGLKNGDFVFEDYNRLVMKGVTMHCVAGRQIWQTWETTRSLMENIGNGVQEKLFNVILDRGQGTILPIADYSKEKFEEMMQAHPKFLIQF